MIDREVCYRRFPPRWRSSITIFSYEPPEESQTYEGLIVSYLKVAFTITGFQPYAEETGIKDRRIDSYFNTPALIDAYKELVSDYYGCYGAILEVAVAPAGAEDNPEIRSNTKGMLEPAKYRKKNFPEYPYFANFEPKKREIYETVSETGERTSRSLEDVDVKKGSGTSSSHEIVDQDKSTITEGMTYAGMGGSFSLNSDAGTKNITQKTSTDLRTTDSLREKRETLSHTTLRGYNYGNMETQNG
jgi:hypothetical protein